MKEGMHPEWADAVTDAYIANQLRDEKGRIRTQLISQFRDGYISEGDLRAELEGLSFRPESVDMSVKEARLKRDGDYLDDLVKFYSTQLQKHAIAPATFETKMRDLGIAEEVVQLKKELITLKYPPKS